MNGSKRYFADTNILLRFLVGEPAAQATAARKLFTRAKAGEVTLEISPIVVAEVFYTLLRFYKVPRSEAAETLLPMLRQKGIKLQEEDLVFDALARLQTTNVSFVDAFVAATCRRDKLAVASFDRDFDKFKDVTRYEPIA